MITETHLVSVKIGFFSFLYWPPPLFELKNIIRCLFPQLCLAEQWAERCSPATNVVELTTKLPQFISCLLSPDIKENYCFKFCFPSFPFSAGCHLLTARLPVTPRVWLCVRQCLKQKQIKEKFNEGNHKRAVRQWKEYVERLIGSKYVGIEDEK